MSLVAYLVMESKTLVFENNSLKTNSSLLREARKKNLIPEDAAMQKIEKDDTTHFVFTYNYSDTVKLK